MISEMIYAEYVQRASLELFRMQLLVENTKAGRIVGPRGQTISMLKNKSGVAHLNMSKDPEVGRYGGNQDDRNMYVSCV